MSTTRRSSQHERLRSLTRRMAFRPSSSAPMGLRTAPNRIFCAAPVGLLGVIARAPESAGRLWVVLPALLPWFGLVRA